MFIDILTFFYIFGFGAILSTWGCCLLHPCQHPIWEAFLLPQWKILSLVTMSNINIIKKIVIFVYTFSVHRQREQRPKNNGDDDAYDGDVEDTVGEE